MAEGEGFSVREILLEVQSRLNSVHENVKDCRERIIRLEAKDLPQQINDLRDDVKKNSEVTDHIDRRLTVIETQGKTFSGGISALVSVVVAVAVLLIGKALGL